VVASKVSHLYLHNLLIGMTFDPLTLMHSTQEIASRKLNKQEIIAIHKSLLEPFQNYLETSQNLTTTFLFTFIIKMIKKYPTWVDGAMLWLVLPSLQDEATPSIKIYEEKILWYIEKSYELLSEAEGYISTPDTRNILKSIDFFIRQRQYEQLYAYVDFFCITKAIAHTSSLEISSI